MDPPRPISNRVVKRGSAAGTGAAALGDKVRALILYASISRRGAVAARRAHNPKVDGSNPSAATIILTRTSVTGVLVLRIQKS